MKSLGEITEKIENEAGFDVFAFVNNRQDCNDFSPDTSGRDSNYVRAVYNLKNAKPGFFSSIPYSNEKVGGLVERDAPFDRVAYGSLPAKSSQVEIKVPFKTQVKQKKTGLAGLFGKTELVDREVINTERRDSFEGINKLPEVVQTDKNDDAYFLEITIKTKELGRQNGNPRLTIVGDRDLIVDTIVPYLKTNPSSLYDFVRAVLPADRFPKVNAGILSQITPGKSIFFIDTDKYEPLEKRTDCDYYLKKFVYSKYGQEVKV